VTATLDEVESALFACLGSLVAPGGAASPSQPFRRASRFAGELTPQWFEENAKGLHDLAPSNLPAAFLAFEDGRPLGDEDGAYTDTLLRDTEVVVRSLWRIYVVVGDLRGDAAALKAAVSGQPGALLCVQRVMEAFAGMDVDGLFAASGVRLVRVAPWLIAKRVAYVYVVQVAASASLPATTEPTPGEPFAGMDTTITDAPSDEGSDPMPLAAVRAVPVP
jgi:hypothetical protein